MEESTTELAGDESAEAAAEREQAALKEKVLQRQQKKTGEAGAEEQPVPLKELEDNGTVAAAVAPAEIDLNALIDVQVTLSVEIGRSRMPIKQLISLNQGSVVELDRAVNEPLDLLVNGTLIARGEVVVVDGQFGLRLIDVVSQSERLKKLK